MLKKTNDYVSEWNNFKDDLLYWIVYVNYMSRKVEDNVTGKTKTR